MFVKLLFRLIFGYVRIEVEGYYLERFINICVNKKILIWNLKKIKGVKVYLNIGIKDFKKLGLISKKTNCKIRILSKKGIPFFLHKYKKRKIFVICLIIVIVSIYISSNYIWSIDIIVKDNININGIEQDLKELGVKKGALKHKINVDNVINNLRLKRDDISWIGIDINGTNIKVNIVKADKKPEILDKNDYCDIVASKSGKISKIIAQNGTVKANVGDYVEKGDILIAGYMEGKYTDVRKVHSLGEVIANVIYEKTEEFKLKQNIYVLTGNYENKYEIKIGNYKIKLYNKFSKFNIYETKFEEKEIKFLKRFYLPVSILKNKNIEQVMQEKDYSVEEAVKQVGQKLEKEIEEKIENKNNIVNKKIKSIESENSVIVTVTYEVEENIGKKQKIE